MLCMVDVGPQRHLVMRMQVLQSLTEDMYTASVHMLDEYNLTVLRHVAGYSSYSPYFPMLSFLFVLSKEKKRKKICL